MAHGAGADPLNIPDTQQETIVDGPWVVRPLDGEKRLAAREKGREGHSVVVGLPAAEIGPSDRLQLRVGNVQRICTGAMCHAGNTHQPRRCRESKVFLS